MHISVLHFCVLMDHKFNWFRYSWFLSSSSFFISLYGWHTCLRWTDGNTTEKPKHTEIMTNTWRLSHLLPLHTARWPSSPESTLTIRWQNKTLGPLFHQRASIIIKLFDGYCVVVVAAGPSLPSSRLTVWTATAAAVSFTETSRGQ